MFFNILYYFDSPIVCITGTEFWPSASNQWTSGVLRREILLEINDNVQDINSLKSKNDDLMKQIEYANIFLVIIIYFFP